MITRRDTLALAPGLGAASLLDSQILDPSALTNNRRVGFPMPADACDCHTHVFLDPAEHPFWSGRLYTPPVATTEQLMALHEALGITRTVVVAPSVYGSDMRPTLEAMRVMGSRKARGVSVYSPHTTAAELDSLHDAGMRGMRVNVETAGQVHASEVHEMLATAEAQAASKGWHIQIYARLSVLAEVEETLLGLRVPLVFDHFAGARGSLGPDQAGLAMVLGLVGEGRAYVKLSAPYRLSTQAPDYGDLTWLAQAFIAANPERMLWGSDWPHPGASPRPDYKPDEILQGFAIDDAGVLSRLADWAPDADTRKRILSDNPARLYGFG
uniref:Amidohydrolase 2 n=1 Tax=Caulobacter sp. (strain K31) TaxID=366602 RepID=B0T6L9_CAUSK